VNEVEELATELATERTLHQQTMAKLEEWRQAARAEADLADERGRKLERANLAFDDQLKEIGTLAREVERREAELRLARAVIHTLMWESSVVITEQPRLRAALEAWGKADKAELHRPDPPAEPPPTEGV
jgi:hypothetical protein